MKLIFRIHALKRMFERDIPKESINTALTKGVVIENYPDDLPYPSRLILGFDNIGALHLVVAEDKEDQAEIIITVYRPDSEKWSEDFKRRK